MFLSFDDINSEGQHLVEAKLFLLKPNGQIVSPIKDLVENVLTLKLGGIHELVFSVPYYQLDEPDFISTEVFTNTILEKLKEKMLVKIILSNNFTEWFVITGVKEVDTEDDLPMLTVTAHSRAYSLNRKPVHYIEEPSINLEDAANLILEESGWTIEFVDAIFREMYRTISFENTNVAEALDSLKETFGCTVIFDNENRRVKFLAIEGIGKFRGLTLSNHRFVEEMEREREGDVITRLYVYGNDRLSIRGANPTGMPYVEDYSFFLYPFERDADRRVIKSSHFMSDALCHALLDHQQIAEENSHLVQQYQVRMNELTLTLNSANIELTLAENEYQQSLELLDLAKAGSNPALITQRQGESHSKSLILEDKREAVLDIEADISIVERALEDVRQVIDNQAGFTPALVDELSNYIFTDFWEDDTYIDAEELYRDGIEELKKRSSPTIASNITLVNLLYMIDESYRWDKIQLGDIAHIRHIHMGIDYRSMITEIEYDLVEREAKLTLSDSLDFMSKEQVVLDAIMGSANASSVINRNKYKWDKINAVAQNVNQILTQEWEASKRKILAGVNNSIEISNRGIVVTNPDMPNELVIIQSGIIALSKDGGETWKTAISADGIIAERLIGQIIAGQELVITNNAGSFTFDDNGVVIDADSFIIRSGTDQNPTNLLSVWNESSSFTQAIVDDNMVTAYEKKMLKYEWDEIYSEFDGLDSMLGLYFTEDEIQSNAELQNLINDIQLYKNYLMTETQGDGYALLDSDNMHNTTRVNGAELVQNGSRAKAALSKLNNLILGRTHVIIKEAEEMANTANNSLTEIRDNIIWKLELTSSNGLMFRDAYITTELSATVYRGAEDVTSSLPNNAFKWTKTNADGTPDVVWNTNNAVIGKRVLITHEDIVGRATFNCEVEIE